MKRAGRLRAIPFDVSLRDALGERLRVLPDDCAKYAVAGVVPKSVALPRKEREAALALAAAGAEGATVALRGAGTKSDRPPAPRAIDVVIDTTALDRLVDHAAADLTVTVGAGMPLVHLEAALAQAGQFWPCDAPFAQRATVGGTIAANANGALRLRYGPIRDLLLGARVLMPDGVAVRIGSRVVKSVAGYDLQKLMVGSFGTLGLIVEATLKVAPLPEVERLVVAGFSAAAPACVVARAIAGSNLFPMAITLHDDGAARKVGALLAHASARTWLLVVRCGGSRKSVARQVADVADLCANAGAVSTDALDQAAARRAAPDLRELGGGEHYPAARHVVLKVTTLPTDVAAAIAQIGEAWPSAEVSAQPASGIVFAHLPVDAGTADAASAADVLRRAAHAGWSATLLAVPRGFSVDAPAAAPGAPVRLLRAVKAAFDPAGVLDPGRLPGGV